MKTVKQHIKEDSTSPLYPIKANDLYCCQFEFTNFFLDIKSGKLWVIKGKDIVSRANDLCNFRCFKVAHIESDGKASVFNTVYVEDDGKIYKWSRK